MPRKAKAPQPAAGKKNKRCEILTDIEKTSPGHRPAPEFTPEQARRAAPAGGEPVGVAGGLPAGLVAVGVTRRRGRKPRARIAAEKDRVERPPVPGAVRAELQRARQELQEVNRQLEEARRQLVQIREEIQTAGGEAQVTEIKVPVSPEQGTAARPE